MELTETTVHTRDIYRNLMKCVAFESTVKLVLLFLGIPYMVCPNLLPIYHQKPSGVVEIHIIYAHTHAGN